MSWSGQVKVHGSGVPIYRGSPQIYINLSCGDISRSNSKISCKVTATLQALSSSSSYFGFTLTVYAQLDNGTQVQLFSKDNKPSRWSTGDYKGTQTISSTNTGTSAKIKIFVKSDCDCSGGGSAIQVWSASLSAPPLSPPVLTLTKSSFTSSSLSWECSSNVECDAWKYCLDNGTEVGYGVKGKTANGTLNVSAAEHRVYIKGRRTGGTWGTSGTVNFDCRIPTIVSPKITPTSDTQGNLTFSSSHDVNFYLDERLIGSTKDKKATATITIEANTLKTYTLLVKRTDNVNITNSVKITVDTRKTSIVLTGYPNHQSIIYYALATDTCKDWYSILTWKDENNQEKNKVTLINSNELRGVGSSVDNLEIDTKYTLQVYATRVDNNSTAYSNVIEVIPAGSVRVFEGNKTDHRKAGVWIWHNGYWNSATPLIYTKGEDGKLGWQICK